MERDTFDKIREATVFLQSKINSPAAFCLVGGTGLEITGSGCSIQGEISYGDIPHFPSSKVESHAGKLRYGIWHGQNVYILSGRSHYYEGYSAAAVAFPVQVMANLGVKHIIFTNAAGGVNPHFKEGDIVALEDHINLIPDNPLRGFHDERLGLRFPDMMYTYDDITISNFITKGLKEGISVKKGVYLALPGPSLETPAEYNMAYRLGADLVGMSTVPEVIAARHAGMKVTAFSIVSNVCYPRNVLSPTTVEDVIRTVRASAGRLMTLIDDYFKTLNTSPQDDAS